MNYTEKYIILRYSILLTKKKDFTPSMKGPMMFDGKNSPGGRMRDMTKKIDKPQNMWASVARIFSYWKEHTLWMAMLLISSFVEVGCSILSPILIGKAIDESIDLSTLTVDFDKLNSILILLILVYICNSLFSLIQQYGMTVVTLKISDKVRTQLMEKIQTLSIRFFDTHQRGDLMSRFTSDVELMKSGLGDSFIQVFNTIFSLAGTIISMFLLSPALTLLCIIMIPFVFLMSNIVVSNTRKYFSAQQKALGEMNSLIVESVGGIKVVRCFGLEERQIEAFNEANERLRSAGVKAQIFSGLLMPLMRVLENLIYIIVAVCGGILASGGEFSFLGFAISAISVGTIQSFLLYTRHFLRPINSIASQLNSVQSAIAGAERIFTILDLEPEIVNNPDAVVLKEQDVKGKVEFKDVCFGYEKDKPILKNISFTANQDEVIAIVGSTGAGKSTIINLLTRFYDIDSGTITIDGIDIRNITQESLRDQMGIVLQTPFLFTESVRYNVSYGWSVATEEEIINASRLAEADGFIRRLPEGYNTILLRGGDNISHGQKQLLTIARAILVETPILVFDEATSGIDTHTELLIQKAINNLTKGRTSFIIAHRISTIKNADKILVIEDGRIVEQGKHQELLEKKGRYYDIYQSL